MEKPQSAALSERLAGQHVFVGRQPVKIKARVTQQTDCLLFTVVQIDSVRSAFEAPLIQVVCTLLRPRFDSHSSLLWVGHVLPTNMPRRQQLPPRAAGSSLHRPCVPAATGMRCEPVNNTFFFFLSFFSKHACPPPVITLALFGLGRAANPKKPGHKWAEKKYRFYHRGASVPENDFFHHKCHTKFTLHHCITGKKYVTVKQALIGQRTDCSVMDLWKIILMFFCDALNVLFQTFFWLHW